MQVIRILSCAAVLSLGLAVGCATTHSTPRHTATTGGEPHGLSTVTLTVHGMGCPLCANNVDKQLLAVPGVQTVNVDLGTGRVTVRVDEANRPSDEQLAHAVHQSGFTLQKIEIP